jgi:hypothetical protein
LAIKVDKQLRKTILENKEYFRLGAIGPDFFPDVFFGILVSHQTDLRKQVLTDYFRLLAGEIESNDPHQLAFAFGWLSHVCADVFGHHWVGMESNGDFLTWTSTPPAVIRRHLGIEMLWDKRLPEASKETKGLNAVIRRLTTSMDSKLCNEFYRDNDYYTIAAMIQVSKLADWHEKQRSSIEDFRERLDDADIGKHLRKICPICHGAGLFGRFGRAGLRSVQGDWLYRRRNP